MTNNWTQISIASKSADVYDPPGKPRFGILHLHGAGLTTLRDKPAFTRLLAELNLACICPHGQRSWWGDRICAEFDPAITPEQYLLQNVLPYFGERWGLAEGAVALMGISMGGQGALRLAFKYPAKFPVVAGIASAIDYYETYGEGSPLDAMYNSKEQCRQDSAPLHLHPSHYPPHILFCVDPDDDKWFRGNDRLHEKMNALGVPHEIDFTTRAGGHSWDYFNHMADRVVRFVHAGLENQSRRLL
jgi:pimeloyl-ACP methyl ester carboxylesterase